MKSARTFLFLALSSFGAAADLTPQLGTLGDKLLEETFSGTEVPKGWVANTGTVRVADGVLLAAEKGRDVHIGTFHHPLVFQDCCVQIDFKLGDAREFFLCFEPAEGELKKTGILFSIRVCKTEWRITGHKDDANIYSQNKILAISDANFDPATTYTLLLECKGDNVVAQIAGKQPLKATGPDFHVKKPGLVILVGGTDEQEAAFDNLKVWALK
ncbi:MAG: hypothetical protein ACYC67_16115 [Prosthecobacter sp.]